MASKKYTLLALLMMGFGLSTYAQLGGAINYYDSSKYSSKQMSAFNDWRSNPKSSIFPPKPRDMWQLGINFGTWLVDGDASPGTTGIGAIFPGWTAGVSLRKSLGYVVSVRGSIGYGVTTGLDYRKNGNLGNAPVLDIYRRPGSSGAPNNAIGPGWYVHNYQTSAIMPALDVMFSLGNLSVHSKQSKINPYAFVGYMPFVYRTRLDQRGSGNAPYNYAQYSSSFFGDNSRKDIKKELWDNLFDQDFESAAGRDDREPNFDQGELDKYQIRHSANIGLGAEWRIGKRTSLSGEIQYTKTFDDWIDGAAYQGEAVGTAPIFTSDKDNLFFAKLGLNFNLGNANSHVAPLWWYNPLSYVYHEARNPIIPKPILDDSDNDGVTDQFDIEPNTPAGCPVDTKGKSRDTDGDGVPDCRDKELITPTACQPVDADGVGKCPDPACCDKIVPVATCSIGYLPSVSFGGSAIALSSTATSVLDGAAAQIKANPLCRICVVGHGGASKREQQLSWDRVNSVINYLVEKQGIGRDRFVFKYGEDGDKNTVDLQDCSGEDGPNMVPAPHPQYRKTK